MPLRTLIVALCLCLVGCTGNPAPMPPSALAREHRLVIRPYLAPSRSAQALVPNKTVADINYLLVIPLIDPGDGQYHTISKASGEPLDPLESFHGAWDQIVLTGRSMPGLSFEQPLVITGLRAYGRYRLQAMAFDRDGRLISRDEDSVLDLQVENDDSVRSAIPLPVQLMETGFSACFRLTLTSSGAVARLMGVMVTIKRLGSDATPPQVVARIPLSTLDLKYPLQVYNLNAQTRYVIELEPQVSGEGGIPASQSFEVEVGQDDALPDREVTFTIPSL